MAGILDMLAQSGLDPSRFAESNRIALQQARLDSAPAGSVGAPGGLLGAQRTPFTGSQLTATQLGALALSPVPVAGDVAGLLADFEMFRDQPESRTPLNFSISALGALPFVPSIAAIKSVPIVSPPKTSSTAKFNTGEVWYRGQSGDHGVGGNSFWTNDPDEAGAFAAGVALTNDGTSPNILAGHMAENINGRSIDDEILDALDDGVDPDSVAQQILADEGLDFVEFHHPSATKQTDQTVRVVKDPKNILNKFGGSFNDAVKAARSKRKAAEK